MKLPLLFVALLATVASAQWVEESFSLQPGWNAIHLQGDASHATPDQLFGGHPIDEVWRWNTNPNEVGFLTNPSAPTFGTPDWSVWRKGDVANTTLSVVSGQTSYLLKVDDTASAFTLNLTLKAEVPRNQWLVKGGNLIGFPASANSPVSFDSYFDSFQEALPTIGQNSIYEYVGGDLTATNPRQVFSTAVSNVQRGKAYWFEVSIVNDFIGPLGIDINHPEGLRFGSSGTLQTIRLRNRTSSPMTVNLTPRASEAVPTTVRTGVSLPALGGGGLQVPLEVVTIASSSTQRVYTPIGSGHSVTIPAESVVGVTLSVDRSSLPAGNTSDIYQSLLDIEVPGQGFHAVMPVSASQANLQGLWVGEALVSGVRSLPQRDGAGVVSPVSQSFPLRFIMHVDGSGNATFLSQAYIGKMQSGAFGVSLRQAGLDQTELENARKISATHLPPDTSALAGAFAPGATLSPSITIPFDSPSNPFVHQYHPDHDNLDARFQNSLNPGDESYQITRSFTFDFSAAPPAGESRASWGVNVIGGDYAESIGGIMAAKITQSPGTVTEPGERPQADVDALPSIQVQQLQTGGTFRLYKVVDYPTLDLN